MPVIRPAVEQSARPTSSARFEALALCVTTESLAAGGDPAAARQAIARTIRRISEAITSTIAFIGEQSGSVVRLVVLPEYSLTGAPSGGPFVQWRARAAIAMNGPEYDALAVIAAREQVFLAGNAYEADDYFPDLYFQTSFILSPAGSVVLRYRRLVSLYSPSPYDVLEQYLAIYGANALFPVADTEIGRLAAVASEEILYPEISRGLVMRGAEILVHSTSEMGSPALTAKDIAKRARAAENLVYVVSANAAGVTGTALPAHSTTGMAKIVNYEGRALAEAPPGGDSLTAHATIDLAALRARRRQAGLSNTLVRQPFQAYAESYAATAFHASGRLTTPAGASSETLRAAQRETIERLARLGLI